MSKAKQLRNTVGSRIREHRIELGWSQGELADRIKRDRTWVNKVERGHIAPSLPLFVVLLDALEVNADWVLDR